MEILILSVLIILNGLFALSEIALVSSKSARLEQAKLEGSKGAKKALELLNNSESFLSAVQVGITLIGIVTGVYGGMNIADDVTPFFTNFELTRPYDYEIALTLTVLLITYVSIVIGELVPKTIALTNPEKIAIRIAPFISVFSKIFYPFVRLLSFSTNIIVKILGVQRQSGQITETELRQMIKIASKEGVIEEEQNIIHEKVFYFSDKKAKHLMTHRTDIEWLDVDRSSIEIKNSLKSFHHSKLVCCSGTQDNFLGVLFLKDYYKAISEDNLFDIKDLITEPIIVHENSNAQQVLNHLRQKKTHMCFVVNEYGGFEGIITLHDILENIVGQIPEEGESYEPDVFIRDDNSVLVSGDAPIESLTEIIENFTIDFEKIDYSTVAGFMYNKMHKVPQMGDKIEFMGYELEVVDIDSNRIDKVLIYKLEENS